MNHKKQLHYIYKDTLRHVTSYPSRWKRFLKYCDQIYPMSFENMVLLYGQDPKATFLATEEQWQAMGRIVTDDSKGVFAFSTIDDEARGAYFFDLRQTDGEPVPARWRLDENTQHSYLNTINRHRSQPTDSVERYLRDMIARDVQNYGPFAEASFLKALRDREYSPVKIDSLQKSFRPMLERNIRYLVGNRCDFTMHSLPATGRFRYIRDFNDVYSATLFGVVSTDMARAVLTRVEHYVQRLEAKENLIYETELYQARTFTLSRNSDLERSEGRPSAGGSREEDLQEAEAGEQVELYDSARRRRADGQGAPGRGNGQSEAAGADQGNGVERTASGGSGTPGAADAGNQGPGGGADHPGNSAELELIALDGNCLLKSNMDEGPSKDGSIFTPEAESAKELPTVLLCPPEEPPVEKQMDINDRSLREAVGGPYIDIEYRHDISCICKETAVAGTDPFNRIVAGELISGPIVFVHKNANGSYSSLPEKDLEHLKLKFAAPLIDVGREMGKFYGFRDTPRINKAKEPAAGAARNGKETVMEKRRLFIDMDGTLAEFRHVNMLETLYEPGYFSNLKPQQNVLHAAKNLSARGDVEVYVLSAYLSDSPYAWAEKNMWLDRYLPEVEAGHRLFIPCGADKRECIPGGIRPGDYLLDDYTHNLTQWEASARGIKLLNGINHTHGTWTHDRVWYGREPADLTEKIMDIVQERGHVYDVAPEEQKNVAESEKVETQETDAVEENLEPVPKDPGPESAASLIDNGQKDNTNDSVTSATMGNDLVQHALLDAIQANDGVKVSQWLAEHQADANRLIAGATPLHHAVEHGADKSAAVLLKRGAYVDAIDEDRKTPLFRAVERGDAKMVRQLLKASADPELSDGKQVIQDIAPSKAIKSMLDEYTAAKDLNLGRGMTPGIGKGRGRH